jgi:glycosyltransferase involved in cell wall biosynthesis
MKFHALLPVRDEADIIDQSLNHLLTWADAVYVFDTGSFDETWELVQQCASKDKRVVPLKKADVFFSYKRVRAWMFHHARQWMREGDWFARVDADEFHHVSPPEFVKTRVAKHETVACHQYYDFRLTASEVKAWDECRETLAARTRPIDERRRWFTLSPYTEPRLCRYRESMQWPDTVSFPYNAGYIAKERLPIRHYPHRDPVQLQYRCRIRAIMMLEPDNSAIRHWALADWRDHIIPDDSPDLRYWKPQTDLPNPQFANHLAPAPKRAFQRLAHALFLPIFDRFRPPYPHGALPRAIPEQVNRQLAIDLGLTTRRMRARGLETPFNFN